LVIEDSFGVGVVAGTGLLTFMLTEWVEEDLLCKGTDVRGFEDGWLRAVRVPVMLFCLSFSYSDRGWDQVLIDNKNTMTPRWLMIKDCGLPSYTGLWYGTSGVAAQFFWWW
jgi:hypothetical protein